MQDSQIQSPSSMIFSLSLSNNSLSRALVIRRTTDEQKSGVFEVKTQLLQKTASLPNIKYAFLFQV